MFNDQLRILKKSIEKTGKSILGVLMYLRESSYSIKNKLVNASTTQLNSASQNSIHPTRDFKGKAKRESQVTEISKHNLSDVPPYSCKNSQRTNKIL